MARGLKIAEPSRRRSEPASTERAGEDRPIAETPSEVGEKFAQLAEHEKVQFNKRVTRGVADGYEMLAIRTRRRAPQLLAEDLALLEERYGKV